MKIIGLTGGIGSGKTTVAKMFKVLGVPIYIADLEAKKLMITNKHIKQELITLFGKTVYNSDNTLNKTLIAGIIFSDKAVLKKMNNIVHPEVARHFNAWVLAQKSAYVIKESAILFENNAYKSCHFVITVTAPKNIRLHRVLDRDQTTKDKVEAIMNNQWTDAKKIEQSHFVINNINLIDTKKQVEQINASLETRCK